jgi:hypothetical protein
MTAKLLANRREEDSRRRRRRALILLALLLLLLPAIALTWIFPATSAGISEGFSSRRSAVPSVPASGATSVATSIPSTPAATGLGDGSGAAQITGVNFTISSGGAANLSIGVPTAIRLTLANPNDVAIYVTALSVAVSKDGDPVGCASRDNIRITQSNVSAADPILIPAGGGITLTSGPGAPQITLINRPDANQDACKGKAFTLAYSGSAHS